MLFEPIQLGSIQLIRRVGHGGMGEVWQGFHGRQRTPVAVKFVLGAHASEPRRLVALRNEVRQVARLSHPAVVLVLDQGQVSESDAAASAGHLPEGSPYLVMEFASGGTLHDVMDRSISWESVYHVLLVLLDALAYAHARGILHRDLKPENILVATQLDLRPGLKLSDFGLAATLHDSVPLHGAAGSPHYMAPEQIRGDWSAQGPWTDLYALGCLAYQLVSGRPPFHYPSDPRNTQRILNAHLSAPIPPLFGRPGLVHPVALESWLHRLLAKEPSDRFPCAADARRALQSLPQETEERVWSQPLDAVVETLDIATVEVQGVVPNQSEWTGQGLPSWHDDPGPTPVRLLDAGLGLFWLRTPPLLGRTAERDRLWSALERMLTARQPGAALITGPTGCGKTALAEWFSTRAVELGLVECVHVSCDPRSAPGSLLSSVVRNHQRLARRSPGDARAALGGLESKLGADEIECAALVRWVLGPEESTPEPDEHTSADERIRLLLEYLRRHSLTRPLLVVLDDVHWDKDALLFAQTLLTYSRSQPNAVLVVLTSCDDLIEDAAMPNTLESLVALDGVELIRLGSLSEDETRKLIDRFLPIESQLAEAIVHRSGGNPHFVHELLGEQVRRGALEVGTTGFRLRPGLDAALPGSIVELWRARVTRVLQGRPESVSVILELAAALGQQVDEAEWELACAEASVVLAPAILDMLLAQRILDQVDGGYQFSSRLLNEAILAIAQQAGRLERVHRACAEALGRLPVRAGRAERRGRHWLAAGQCAKAWAPLLDGVHEAIQVGVYHRAQGLIEMCEGLLKREPAPSSDQRWGVLGLTRVQISMNEGRFSESDELASRLVERARRARWWAVLAGAWRYRGLVALKRGDLGLAELALTEAMRDAQQADDQREVARSLMYLGTVSRSRNEGSEAMRLLNEARQLFEILRDEVGLADCLMERANTRLTVLNQATEAEGDLRLALAGYQHLLHSVGIASCQVSLGDILRRQGAVEEAEQLYRLALDGFTRVGSHARIFPMLNLGLLQLSVGQLEEARRWLIPGLEEAERARRHSLIAYFHVALAPVILGLEGVTEGVAAFNLAERSLEDCGIVDLDIATALERMGDLARDARALDLAQRAWALAESQFERTGEHARAAAIRGRRKSQS